MVIKKNTVFTPLKTLFDLSSFEKPISLFLCLCFNLIFLIYERKRKLKEGKYIVGEFLACKRGLIEEGTIWERGVICKGVKEGGVEGAGERGNILTGLVNSTCSDKDLGTLHVEFTRQIVQRPLFFSSPTAIPKMPSIHDQRHLFIRVTLIYTFI